MDFELLQDDLDIEVLDLNIEPCTNSKSEHFELVHSVQPLPHNSIVTKSQRLFSPSSGSSQNFDNTHTRQQTSPIPVKAANSVTVQDNITGCKREENRDTDRTESKISETPGSVRSHLDLGTLSFDNINSVHKREKKEENKNNYLGEPKDSDEYDLVIVGSGVSGLYALFTILSKQPQYKNRKILMIEQSGIIGGRLRTDIIQGSECTSQREGNTPVAPDSSQAFVACEEGGMRFCLQFDDENEISKNQVMPYLVDLITDLRPFDEKMSNIEPFKMVPDGPVDFRRCWFSGRSFTSWYAQQNPGVWENIFYLDTDERNLSPEDIYSEVYRLILKENYARLIGLLGERKAAIVLKQQNYDKLRMIQDTSYWYNFRKYFTWNNVAINQYTMRSLMTVMGYSQGCIKMLEMSGFQCFTMGRGNAGIIIQMSMSHKVMSDSFYCFTYGFGALIDALKAGINHKLGSGLSKDRWILLNHQVTDIKLGEGSSKLSDDFTQLIAKNISKNGDSDIRKIKAKDLILAVPRKAFETISISKIPDHDSTSFRNNLVDSVVDVNMTKINLYFDEAWWNKDQVYKMYGNNTTDLPIAQVYPFYNNVDDGVEPGLCALTIYCDVENSGFWSDLQHLPGLFTSDLQENYSNLQPASLEVVEEALRELRLLFNIKNIPYPVLTTYTRWAGDNTNPVAIHQWKRGVDDRLIREKIERPFPDRRVFICNEAWSEFQGWVEGSLMATQEAVKALLSTS